MRRSASGVIVVRLGLGPPECAPCASDTTCAVWAWKLDALGLDARRLGLVSYSLIGGDVKLTGLLSICWRLLRPFLMWLLRALESRGLSNSKLHRSSADTDMTAPQLSNSPQYLGQLAK